MNTYMCRDHVDDAITAALAAGADWTTAELLERLHVRRQRLFQALRRLRLLGVITKSSRMAKAHDGRVRRHTVYSQAKVPVQPSSQAEQRSSQCSNTTQEDS